jgi:hypothetical protein
MSIGHVALVTAGFSVSISAGCVRDQLARPVKVKPRVGALAMKEETDDRPDRR